MTTLQPSMTPFTSIHNKLHKVFNNPNINFFIIMNLVLLISCYTFINTTLKNSITSFISNPIIILFILIVTIFIGYYNINISILIVLLLFIILYGSTQLINNNNNNNNNKNNKNNNNNNTMEGFTDNTDNTNNDEDEDEDEDNDNDTSNTITKDTIEKNVKKYKRKTREDNKKSREESINKFKNILLGSFNKIKNSADNEYNQGILENKQMMYENEKQKNNKNKKSTSKTNVSKKNQKEDFKTIKERNFDPSNEEDTNFLITKEILQDMINRIDYNFESNTYLKKYLKHRVEEIVDINKLLEDSDD